MFFKILVLALPALTFAQSGGYADTCSDCTIFPQSAGGNPFLSCGSCGDGHGGYQSSDILLTNCFANSFGYVVYRVNGDFAATCDVEGDNNGDSIMSATCGNGMGGTGYNHIDLNDYIGNSFGNLVC